MFLKHFEHVLKDSIAHDGKNWTIIDVFGGSGLLAHNAKRILPKATVIYNDFDGYVNRLAHIDDTNRLRGQLYQFLQHEVRYKSLSKSAYSRTFDVITNFDGFIDVQTVAKWLIFSGRQVANLDELLSESHFYNCINKQDYDKADGYLDGLVITHDSFELLLAKYQDTPNCLLVLDPPYLCTKQEAYGKRFGMAKFLQLMHFVRPPFIFFSSTKSELLDYMAYIEQYEPDTWQRVGGFERIAVKANLNKNASYEDNMLVRF